MITEEDLLKIRAALWDRWEIQQKKADESITKSVAVFRRQRDIASEYLECFNSFTEALNDGVFDHLIDENDLHKKDLIG